MPLNLIKIIISLEYITGIFYVSIEFNGKPSVASGSNHVISRSGALEPAGIRAQSFLVACCSRRIQKSHVEEDQSCIGMS